VTDSTIRRGFDTWVSIDFPSAESGDAKYPKLKTAANRILLHFPVPSLRGRTVLSATLTGHVQGSWSAQTVTATRLVADWAASTANWTNQPGTTGSGASLATGALTDGAEFAINVTTMMQTVAAGGLWFGFRITTDAATQQSVYGFDSGQPSWTLTYELSDAPEQPTILVPDGGVVSATKPKVSWDFTDFGGSTEQAAFRVQVDPAGSAPTNLLSAAASDMESGIAAWTSSGTPVPTLTSSTAQAYEGTKSLLITWAGSGGFPQAITTVSGLTIGQTYTAFFNVYVPTGDANVIPIFGTTLGATVTVKDAWTPGSATFVATATSHSIGIRGSTPVNTDLCYVDGVRVSLGATIVPGYDSGTQTGVDPVLDLSLTNYPGFSTPGSGPMWRVQVRDGSGLWSDWSDWASWIYRAKPSLVMDSPSGTTLNDPTPVIQAHISSGALANYRIRVANGTDKTRIRYDSFRRVASGTTITHTIPFKNDDGVRIFNDAASWWLNVRVEDTFDREATSGDPIYIETWVNVTQVDGAPTAPVLTSVTQPSNLPKVRLVFTRGSTPDGWVILRDGQPYARLLGTDPTNVSGTYTWDDTDYTSAYRSHDWKVKAVTTGVGQGPASNTIAFTSTIAGVWLVGSLGGVKLRGTVVSDWAQLDRAAIYKPLRRPVDVPIIDAQEGLAGSFSGVLHDETGITRETAVTRLEAIKDNITQPVWLLAADLAIQVRVLNLTYLGPDEDTLPTLLRNRVSFVYSQSSGITYGV
jgi:hypothetical protein